jgi:hypothetical protein
MGPQTNVNKATRDTPFYLVYVADVVLPPEIYLESARVAHFNLERQAEAKRLDSILLEERRNGHSSMCVNIRNP